ncbi:hypothetical protein BVRB_2g047410 [Beta vulgaris subsp. vulgaris]|uniref:Uncharacterized protein n=1 Tax=Beta vulgaris subsp. vulgaris TaxID=3555 RepID=A0A0J8BGI7_BETVV|nr:hypothetical protein BVRB_2g047410 [Beta vulgaris subsp. vulgaris]
MISVQTQDVKITEGKAHEHGFAWCCWIQGDWKVAGWCHNHKLGVDGQV